MKKRCLGYGEEEVGVPVEPDLITKLSYSHFKERTILISILLQLSPFIIAAAMMKLLIFDLSL